MPTEQVLNKLIINKVDSCETLKSMKNAGLLNETELYLVEEEEGGSSGGVDEEKIVEKISEHNQDSEAHADIREAVAAAVPLAGGTMTGALTLSGDPTNILHAATKQYVDANKAVTYTATVTETWTADGDYFYQDIVVDGIQTTDNPTVDILTGDDNALNVQYSNAICKVFRVKTSANSIQVWATEAVAMEFPIQLKVVR